jgi:Protein of unknown function (DUF4242)
MRKFVKHISLLILGIALTSVACIAQNTAVNIKKTDKVMKTYVIERDIPGAGSFSPEKLKAISQTSCTVLKEMGPKIEWDHSYVTGDKIFCVYRAENMELIKEHAKRGGFPANNIYEVSTVISPATATN